MSPDHVPNDPADQRLTLTTLGRVALDSVLPGGERVRKLDPGKPLMLIAYLASSERREATRSHLIDLLWGHLDRDKAQNALRQTLWLIKLGVGPGLLSASRTSVALQGQLHVDRDALLEAAQHGRLDEVAKLYTGEFLPDFADPGGAELEAWIEVERMRLRMLFIRSAEEVAQQLLARGRPREALAVAIRVRETDRLRDAGWRLVIESHLAAGDIVHALVEVDALSQLHDVEGIDAEPATTTLARAVRLAATRATHDAPPSAPPELVVDLVGREREFSTVMQSWEMARRGRPLHLHLVAPPGLGKTRLLRDVNHRLRKRRAFVVQAGARYGARGIAYSFASDVAEALCAEGGARGVSSLAVGALLAMNPSLSSLLNGAPDNSVGDEALRRRTIAVRELIKAVAEEQPLALLLDDLHWSDPLSARLLYAAIGGIDSGTVLTMTATRPLHADGSAPSGATTMPLAPLDTAAVHALLSSVRSLPAEEWSQRLPAAMCEATGGSPLLVLEALHLLLDEDLLKQNGEGWLAPNPTALFAALSSGGAIRQRILQLDASERAVFLVLAAAGVPLGVGIMARAVSANVASVESSLRELEQRGFVALVGNEWSTAHDEYAQAATEVASEDEYRSAASAVGQALFEVDAPGLRASRREMLLAGSLLALGADHHALRRAYMRFVRSERLAGESSSDLALAREFVGSAAADDVPRMLVRSLPMLVRARLVSKRRVMAVMLIGLVTSLAVAGAARPFFRDEPSPDAVLIAERFNEKGTGKSLYALPIHEVEWRSGVWDIHATGKPTWQIPLADINITSALKPDGTGWAATRVVADSGVDDLFDVGVDGRVRRLTYSPGDDQGAAWSPDGRYFVFSSARWNTRDWLQLTRYDTVSSGFTRLTGVEGSDGGAVWSPDGSRIGFVRLFWDGGYSLCVIDADGQNERCRARSTGSVPALLGWSGPRHWLLSVGSIKGTAVVRTAVASSSTDADSTIASGLGSEATMTLSPDGRWVLCECTLPGSTSRSWVVFPVSQPNEMRTVHSVDTDITGLRFAWAPTSQRPAFLDTLRILGGPGPAQVGHSYQLRAIGTDSGGRASDVVAARWRSLDTSIASIDSTGLIHPHAEGRASFQVSAGGWRQANIVMPVVRAVTRLVKEERWQDGLDRAWISFGDPLPRIVADGEKGRAFNSNGDRYYYSGAYSTASFDARNGLWLEGRISTPLTDLGGWQEQLIALFAVTDTARWREWDRVQGDAPPGAHCTAALPSGSGPTAGRQLLFSTPTGARALRAPEVVPTGRWYTVIVQVFPDGRCGVAVDGKALWVSPPGVFAPSVQIKVAGRSVETMVLLGALRLYDGVAPGVTWDSTGGRGGSTQPQRF